MHLKTILTPVALAAVVAAEPCAQVSKLVADANQDKSALYRAIGS